MYTPEKTPGIRTKDGNVKIFPTLLLTLYIIAASVYSSVTLLVGSVLPSEYFTLLLSVAMPFIGIAVCAKLTASIKPLIPFCIIAAVLLFIGADIRVSSAIAVLMTLFAAAAYLLRNKFLWLTLLASAASVAITYYLTESVLVSVASIAFIPISVALYLSFEKKQQRVSAVCSMSATLGVTVALLLVAFIYTLEGSISLDILRTYSEALREELIVTVTDALVAASAQLESTLSTADALSVTTAVVTLAFNLFPAIAAILLFIISYITHSLYISVISHTVDDKKDIIHAISFKMSVTSAILFLVAFFAALILDYEGEGLYATVAQNIYIILFPGLSLVTFGFIGSISKKKGASCLTTLVYLAMFGLILFFPGVAYEIAAGIIFVSAFVGSVLVIIAAVKAKSDNNNDKK